MQFLKAAREYWTPVLQQSAFTERGVLTPEEFVAAGDHLVRTCPTWAWSAAEAGKTRPYLPAEKQYLITRGVPSYRRVNQMNAETVQDADQGAVDETDDWCVPNVVHKEEDVDVAEVTQKIDKTSVSAPVDELDEMLNYHDEGATLDEMTMAHDGAVMNARRYDVSITYDKYYQTPRVYLFGYDEAGAPLAPESIFEDIMTDYAKRTVTIEPHPHSSLPHASIHPCQHGAAMKRVIEALSDVERVPSVDQYIFIFLKFMQSVIPTIEYDYTIDVQFRGK